MEHMKNATWKTATPLVLALLLAGGTSALAQSPDAETWHVDPAPPRARAGAGRERPGPPLHREARRGDDLPEGAVLEWWLQGLRERHPDQFEELQRLRRENPGELRRRMREHRQALRRQRAERFFDAPENREIQELEQTARALAREARNLEGDRRTGKEEELREALSRQFDLREAQRARHVQALEERLEQLRMLLEVRQANRDAIIERRLNEMTGSDAEDLSSGPRDGIVDGDARGIPP
jgi:hypothetical protein